MASRQSIYPLTKSQAFFNKLHARDQELRARTHGDTEVADIFAKLADAYSEYYNLMAENEVLAVGSAECHQAKEPAECK